MDLVSIIIPAYNAEPYIRETLESALKQTWPNKEIIVVDDGSTDNTMALLGEYAKLGVNVVVQENKGACAARNLGYTMASGQYIQWLDSDDLLDKHKIYNQMKQVGPKGDRYKLYCGPVGKFYKDFRKAKFDENVLYNDYEPVNWLINRFNYDQYIGLHGWLISRKIADSGGLWDERLTRDQDGEYICRMVAASDGVKFVQNALSYYRVGVKKSVSSARNYRAQKSVYISTKKSIECLLALRDDHESRNSSYRLLQSQIKNFSDNANSLIEEANKYSLNLVGETLKVPENYKYRIAKNIFGKKVARMLKIYTSKLHDKLQRLAE